MATSAPPPAADATAPAADAAPAKPRDQGRDGKVADMEYYDLLKVPASATDLELKKAYRKAAIVNHPDKGGDEETFKLIGEAYRVLSDNNLRGEYDRYGKKKPTDEVGLKEATDMVSSAGVTKFELEAAIEPGASLSCSPSHSSDPSSVESASWTTLVKSLSSRTLARPARS
jgi:curved DNA-binding protein CbpA